MILQLFYLAIKAHFKEYPEDVFVKLEQYIVHTQTQFLWDVTKPNILLESWPGCFFFKKNSHLLSEGLRFC